MTNKFIDEIYSNSKNGAIKKNIIRYYIDSGETSIAVLSKEMNLSPPTITKIIGELIDEGYVVDYGKQETAGGRRPNIYGLKHDSAYFVGVDINRNDINIGMINFNGNLIHSKLKIPYKFENTRESFNLLCDIINDYLNNCGIEREKILNIGLNISGRVNTNTEHSYSFFYFDEKPLTQKFAEKFKVHVTIDNDSRAMTYGEYLAGGINDEQSILFINASWGLGLGIIIENKLYYGKSGFSGEFGHYPTFDNDVLCHCGKKGCLETEVSGSYIHRTFMQKLQNGSPSILSDRYKKGKEITLSHIVKSALEDDMLAIELIEEVGSKLGKAIAGLINIFNPELVIIGGTLSEAGDYLLLPLKSSVKKYSLNIVSADTNIRISKLKGEAGIIGACMLARSKTVGLI